MTKKKKFLLTTISFTMAATAACLAVALLPKGNLRAIGQSNVVWKHYSERMPGVNPGIKEYWVSCNDDAHQFTAPTEGTIQDASGWDTSLFEENDDRYTYQCTKKIADSALADAVDDTATYGISEGFTKVKGRSFANGSIGADLDISGYDYVTFGLCHNMGYLLVYGGGTSGGDDPETVIAKQASEGNVNFTMWQDAWYYFTLERNAEGKWDTYIGKFATAKRASASLPMSDGEKSANNLKDVLKAYNWSIPEGAKVFCTDVYAGEKGHHYVWDNSKISPVETGTCSVCGDVAERPAPAVDFTTNRYGAKLINKTAGADVGGWETEWNGGTFLHAYNATKLSYLYYNWNVFQMYLPRIDFTKYAGVQFDLASVQCNPASPSGGSTWKIGFTEAGMQSFATDVADTLVEGAKLTFTTMAGKVVAKISSFGSVSELTYDITDENVIKGNESVILYVQSTFNSSSNAIQISNLVLSEQPDAASIKDSSIKEIYLEKQVRRVEQQDAWKSPIGSASNEVGHAEYYKIDGREAIHFSAHYASDSQEFTYNSGWSEWRFAHVQSALKSVTFTYLYEDSNTDTSNDGSGAVHTMCQWYGAAYQARTMNLVADGQWHTITVTGDAYDTNFFVMKIFHFTGDIYISSIIYSANEADIQDASIKEFYTTKQVRRIEQQDVWRDGNSVDETGHAEYFKCGSRDLIHVSAHYASTDPEFSYNSGWSEWRFAHQKAGLTSVTFTYLYQDSNTDTSDDGSGAVHTMCQWYGAAYQARKMTLVADGLWHRVTVTGDVYDINYFVMKIFHFTGDLYISDIIYSMDEADVQDASIKEFFTTKQVRRLEQQDAWKSPIGEASDEAGHKDFIKLDGRETIHVSAHYASTDPKFGYNSGWSEFRFSHQKSGLASVTFTYLYEDSNTDTSNDGSGAVHTMAQWYGAAYQARTMNLVADGQWHTITVTGDAYDINFFVMKIYHFTGDLYISNIIYA